MQDLDTSITQLQHRRDALVESSGLAAVEAQLAALEAEQADAAARRGVLTATQKELEEQIAAISERRDVPSRSACTPPPARRAATCRP